MGRLLAFNEAPLLITFDGFVIPPFEVREFWAQKEACPFDAVDAYIAGTFGHKIIGNFYLAFNKTGRPTRVFASQKEAIVWLRTFLKAHSLRIHDFEMTQR
jgi:hypothetical protein